MRRQDVIDRLERMGYNVAINMNSGNLLARSKKNRFKEYSFASANQAYERLIRN